MGFNTPDISKVPWRQPGFLGPVAKRIREEVGIPAATSWNVGSPQHADEMVRSGQVDLVMLGKSVLADPFWPYHAAQTLGRPSPERLLSTPYAAWLKR